MLPPHSSVEHNPHCRTHFEL